PAPARWRRRPRPESSATPPAAFLASSPDHEVTRQGSLLLLRAVSRNLGWAQMQHIGDRLAGAGAPYWLPFFPTRSSPVASSFLLFAPSCANHPRRSVARLRSPTCRLCA